MAKPTWKAEDYAGKSVRLTEERWRHILEHPEMARQKPRVRETLKKPDSVLGDRKGVFLATDLCRTVIVVAGEGDKGLGFCRE